MQLKRMAAQFGALRFMVDDLTLRSGPARRVLMESPWLDGPGAEAEYALLGEYVSALDAPAQGSLELALARVRDIRGTLRRLAEGLVPDDVEWFEIKSLALNSEKIRELLPACGVGSPAMPDLSALVALLDPEGTRIASFHIYDAYCPELAALRRRYRTVAEEDRQALWERIRDREEEIRATLAQRAMPMAAAAQEALHAIARADILLAKAKQTLRRGLCIPRTAPGQTAYEGLFHPEVKQILEGEGRGFQAVDFSLDARPVLITGSNMGGKSVLLNMAALAQCLFHYGFGIPARRASIAPVERVALCLTQEEGMKRGLSAFAAEMVNIQEVIGLLRKGVRVLAVIDEPAQTTNPVEGAALVTGLLALLEKLGARAVVTTHYSGIAGGCRRLRVKGFREDETAAVTPSNIGQFMDYSLVEETGPAQAPCEALRVAALLGVDEEWIGNARKELGR